jgi:hypothetical protein
MSPESPHARITSRFDRKSTAQLWAVSEELLAGAGMP